MKRNTISTRVWNADQSWYFSKTVKIKGHTLRVDIRRNAFDFQSYAKVHRWNDEEWKQVLFVPITECNCKSISYVSPNVTANQFEADSDNLLEETINILS